MTQEKLTDINLIIKENNLVLVEREFFRQKKHVARVMDSQGNKFILKTNEIEPFQIQLFKTAKLIETQLCFKVPAIVKQGDGWILMEEIEGQFLNDFYDKKPEWCAEVSKKISDSYQLVIEELRKTQSLGNLSKEGKEWLYSRIDVWSKPIVETGLIDDSVIQQIKNEFEKLINEKRQYLFDWFHGNIIGDHIIISGEDIYLIDLAVVPRAGRGYYDFLRALDFMFLKTEDEEKMFNLIKDWIEKYLAEFNEEEVKLIFAFRNIGILGWDILHHGVKYMKGDLERKKYFALKFIKREY